MKIVVTGSSGLLGRHIAAALVAAGHEVAGVDTMPPTAEGMAQHLTADLTDLGATLEIVRDVDAVVHAAAIPRPTGRAAKEVFTMNITATYNVVEAAVLNAIPRLVYASSYSITGFPFNVVPVTPAYFPLDSAYPAAPQDAYALSKWLGEEIVAAAVRRSGLTAVSIRMPWIQTPETFVRDIASRRDDTANAARNLWSYLDARDAGEAFRAAIDAPISGHRRLFISAADTFMIVATAELVAAAYPVTPVKRRLSGMASVFSPDDGRGILGFEPRYSWRSY